MNIFGFNITRNSDLVNLASKSKGFNKQVKYEKELTRVSQDVGKWRRAILYAESEYSYNRQEYYRLLKDVIIDSHLSSVMSQRINGTLCRQVKFFKPDGTENEEITKLFQYQWFSKMRAMILDAKYYGFTMIDLGEFVDGKFPYIEEVPRQFVKPEYGVVVQHPSMTDGISFDDPRYVKWNIFIGERYDLGLLMKAAPWALWKKTVIAYWSEYCEKFGMPMRVGKTNVHDETLKNNMENALKNMGSAFWAMINEGDEIQLLETFNTAAYDIYDKFIERANSEISKLILTQTGTTEEKTYAGSAGVHQDVLKQLIEQDCKWHDSVLNEVVKPILMLHGFQLNDGYFATVYEDNMTMREKAELIVKMMPFVTFDKEYIENEFGVEIEGFKEETKKVEAKKLSNATREYFNTL